MKNIQNKLIVFFFIILTFPQFGFAQDSANFKLSCEVNRIYPPISLTKEELATAKKLIDLNFRYKSSWVKEYISVEVLAKNKGKIAKVTSKSDVLNQEQKNIINTADFGTDISVNVRYIPDNNLKHNDIQEMNFSFSVEPKTSAKYTGGEEKLKQYLKDNVMDKIAKSTFKEHQLTAVKFTINEEGQIIDSHIFESSGNKKTDVLLLESICNMPSWKPAAYANGMNVKQEFVLTIGDKKSCIINLLNIHRNSKIPNILRDEE